jgi:hypothetical protein
MGTKQCTNGGAICCTDNWNTECCTIMDAECYTNGASISFSNDSYANWQAHVT